MEPPPDGLRVPGSHGGLARRNGRRFAFPSRLAASPPRRLAASPPFCLSASPSVRLLAYSPPRLQMPATYSFDVTTGVDLQEVDNAVNQAQKEIAQRYDFKGSKASIEFQRTESQLLLIADDDFRMRALFDVLQAKLI